MKVEVIKTPDGDVKVKDVKVEPYMDGSYILAQIVNNGTYQDGSPYVPPYVWEVPIDYIWLGFDAPVVGDPVWRFWIEVGDINGYSNTYAANLTPEEEQTIKELYQEYRNKSVA